MLERIAGIMTRRGIFPKPPEELQGMEIKIEYMSILASIQKQAAYSGIETLVNLAGIMAQMQAGAGRSPDVLDKIDCDEVIDQLADMYVLPAGIVLGDDKVAEMRQQRQEAEAQAQQQQQMMAEGQALADGAPKAAQAMQTLSETQMPEGGNALQGLGDMLSNGGLM